MPRVTFVATTRVPASAEAVFDWHAAPGAFERLTPPWERVRVLRHEGGIRNGARVSLLVGPGPLSLRWELEHRDYRHGRSFTDVQLSINETENDHVATALSPSSCLRWAPTGPP